MSTDKSNNQLDQEIDLSQISKFINAFFDSISRFIYSIILFIKRNLIILGILFIVGVALGFYLDKTQANYNSHIIVAPNYGSVDYLYSKIDLVQSKINERDTVFLNSIGIKKPNLILNIKVDPIIDIYSFVSSNTVVTTQAQNTQNFELVRLLSEDGDINKVIKDETTSKNYSRHTISVKTSKKVSSQSVIEPLLNYLNQNEYYEKLRLTNKENISNQIKENQVIIDQIDTLLSGFSNSTSIQKNDKLVYYNENTQLNEIIDTKYKLIGENGRLKIELINISSFIKKIGTVSNVKSSKGIDGKMKIVLPMVFLFLFLFVYSVKSMYKKQKAKGSV